MVVQTLGRCHQTSNNIQMTDEVVEQFGEHYQKIDLETSQEKLKEKQE